MDIHELPEGVTPEDVAKAHALDVKVQAKYGVEYSKYWLNESARKIFCLCHAPNPEAAIQVHREAHGLVADNLIEVQPNVAELFLGGTEVDPSGAARLPGVGMTGRDPGIRTILFTDIVDSTALTQSIGDEAAMAMLKVHDTIVRNALASFGGREVKHTGDGIMASFLSAAGAIKCATQIQRELTHREKEGSDDCQIKVRIGAAAGEPVEHHDDLFGCTVQLAARLCSQALPGQILVSNAIPDLCVGKGLSFQDVGEVPLKGFDRPVRTHAVAWAVEASQPLS
jgi:class 3 adenylate cyclase